MLNCVVGLSLIYGSAHAPLPNGRLYVVKGQAHVIGAPNQADQLVQVCRTNDRIEVGAQSVALVWMLGSGARYRLASPSIVRIVGGAPIALKGAKPKPLPKLTSGVSAVFQDSGSQAAVQIRSGPNGRLTPSGGLLNVPDRVDWDRIPEATNYDISLTELTEPAAVLMFRARGITANWVAIPAGVLTPGKLYRLTLAANTANGGCVMGFRTLRVISSPQLTALKRAEKELDSAYSRSPEVQLAKAELYEKYGLYRQCIACLDKLPNSTPGVAEKRAILESLAEGRN